MHVATTQALEESVTEDEDPVISQDPVSKTGDYDDYADRPDQETTGH